MSLERRGHAEFSFFDREVRQGRMIKPSVDLQELRRRIYRKAKAESRGAVRAVAGRDGVMRRSTSSGDSSMNTRSATSIGRP